MEENKIERKTRQLNDIRSRIKTIESRLKQIENNKNFEDEDNDNEELFNEFLKKRKEDLK